MSGGGVAWRLRDANGSDTVRYLTDGLLLEAADLIDELGARVARLEWLAAYLAVLEDSS